MKQMAESMKRPTVGSARAICDDLKCRSVIVMAFTEDGLAGAVYGKTKLERKQTDYTLDTIIEAILMEQIPVWATRESEAERHAAAVQQACEDGRYCPIHRAPWIDCNCYGLPMDEITSDQLQ